jgi:methionyl-tRNA formyltransferase
MLLVRSRPIGLLDNALDLAKDLAVLSAELLPETLRQLDAGSLTATPQTDSEATYAPLIQKADYRLDWTRSAIQLHNQVRGFYPNCTTDFRQKALKIEATIPLGEAYQEQLPEALQELLVRTDLLRPDAEPGTVVEIAKGFGPVVAARDECVLLKTVKPSGKKAQTGWDFANGNRLDVGERLGES